MGLSHHEYIDTEAWKRGEEAATAETAAVPPDDFTASVSVLTAGGYERDYYKLCKLCHHPRNSDRCQCVLE